MKRIAQISIIVFLFGFAATAKAQGPANGLKVQVVNQPTVHVSSIPDLTLSGVSDVNVANTPNVTVTGYSGPTLPIAGDVNVENEVAVSGSVAVTSMPSVEVSSLPAVEISNSPLEVLVSNAETPVREPIQLGVELLDGEHSERSFSFDVPADKWLVVKFVSARVQLNSGTIPVARLVVSAGSGGGVAHYIALQHQGTGGGVDFWVASQEMEAYAAPGSTLQLIAAYQTGLPIPFMGISGYLVDQP